MEKGPGVRDRRVDINIEFDALGKLLSEYVTNVSRSGAFIHTRDPWPVGTRLRLRFTVLAEDPEILEGAAAVVRVSEAPPGMGVVFMDLTPASRALIARLVSRGTPRRPRAPG